MKYQSFKKDIAKALDNNKSKTLEAIGVYVEGEAISRCPVYTGNLRSSLNHKTTKDSVIVGTNVEYALWVEKGTSRQKAQSFLSPAVEQNTGTIKKLAKEMMKL